MSFKFGKEYKLCSKKIIGQLYQSGRDVKAFPFYLKHQVLETASTPFQIVLVVPKKKFRHATTRNQIRRYIREAIRLEKVNLEEKLVAKKTALALYLVYAGDGNLSLVSTRKDIAKLFKKLIYDIEQNNNF